MIFPGQGKMPTRLKMIKLAFVLESQTEVYVEFNCDREQAHSIKKVLYDRAATTKFLGESRVKLERKNLTQVGWECKDGDETESNHEGEQSHVPPCWGFLVFLHHLHMDVRFLIGAVPKLLPDLLAMVEICIYNERCDCCERQSVRQGECSGEEKWRIGFVRL
jgi:hypothetical protein